MARFETTRRIRAGFVELEPGVENVVAAAEDEGFAVTTRNICRTLQCARTFADKHFPDLAKHIYVSRGRTADILGFGGGRLYQVSSLDELVAAGASVTLPYVPVWAEELAPGAAAEIAEVRRSFSETARGILEKYNSLYGFDFKPYRERIGDAIDEHVAPEWEQAWKAWKRSRSGDGGGQPAEPAENLQWMPPAQTWADLAGWRTLADLMNYGDTQEEWHRYIRRHCCAKLTLAIGDSVRVMYGDGHDAPMPADAEGLESFRFELGYFGMEPGLVPEAYGARLIRRPGLLLELAEDGSADKFRH